MITHNPIIQKIASDPRALAFVYSTYKAEYPDEDKHSLATEGQIKFLKTKRSSSLNELYSKWLKNKFHNQYLAEIKGNPREIQLLLFCLYEQNGIPDGFKIHTEDQYTELLALCDFCTYRKDINFEFSRILRRIKFNKQSFDWFDFSDEEKLDWAISYIKNYKFKRHFRLLLPDFYINAPDRNSSNNDVKKLSIMYFIDTLPLKVNDETTELFILKMKRAYSQRKYRNENPERVASNYMLCKEVKLKLKEIAKKERLKLNETIELLINEAHKELE